jgi:putative tryptophan/tyrosine transport system substrate-binding protein
MTPLAVALLGLVLVAVPLAAEAQPPAKVWRVGVLRFDSPTPGGAGPIFLRQFRDGLKHLGYIEGQNLTLEIRWAEGKLDRLPRLAAELVAAAVDVLVTSGPAAIRAAREATATIPIVMGRMDDVDAHGFVKNLARPEGNITGVSFQSGELSTKWLQLVKELGPTRSRVAAMWDANGTAHQLETLRAAARSLDLQLLVVNVRTPVEFERAFEEARRGASGSLVILASPMLTVNAARLAELATRHGLPAIYYNPLFVRAGGLLAYGPSETEFNWGRAAVFVDKILKGAKPSDLPIEQPTRFELVINLKTAKALGLTIPQSVLLRADEVIQ